MPRDLLDLVSSTARRLGRQVAGDDLFLLALSKLSAESAARQALEGG
jgi:hypothetical protein